MSTRFAEPVPWPFGWLAAFACAVALQATLGTWGPPVMDWAKGRHGWFDNPVPERLPPDTVEIAAAVSVVIGPDNRRYIVSLPPNGLIVTERDGSEVWHFNPLGETLAAPRVGPDGTVYVRSSKYLRAFRPDGRLKWELDIAEFVRGTGMAADGSGRDISLVVDADGVYIAFREVWALAPDGSTRWRTTERMSQVLLLGEGVVYALSSFALVAIRTSDGSAMWTLPERNSSGVAGRTADGTILLKGEKRLTAIDQSGRVLWRKRFEGDVDGVAIGADRLFVAARALYALDMKGHELWRFRPERVLSAKPLLTRDSVIVAGRSLFSLSLDGRLQWSLPMAVRQIVAGPDGTVFVIRDDVYALYRLTERR